MNPFSINPLAAARNAANPPDAKDSEDPKTASPKDTLQMDPKSKMPINEQDLIKEISWSETDVLQSYLPFANNPDPIVRSKGLKIYKEMLQDDQVKVCVDVRIQARLSTPWEIVPGLPGNAQSEEMADFIKDNFKSMRGTFETDMEQMFSAITYGFSVSEKIFKYIDSGRFKGKIGLKAIKTREPFNYDFKIDAHGNLLGLIYIGMAGKDDDEQSKINNQNSSQLPTLQVRTGSLNSLNALIPDILGSPRKEFGTLQNPFPPEKFIVYSYSPQFGNWYGRSDLMAAFKWWLMKKHGSRFWAVWIERYASPFIWAQYKRDAGMKKSALEAIDDFIRNLSTRQGVRVSDAVDLNAIQFSGTGADSYEKAIEAYNRYIAHAILFPNLLGFTGAQGSSGGSYALGQKQFDSFMWILNKMGRDMSETIIGEQIIKQLIQINYGEDIDSEMIPKFRFISIEDSSIDVRSQIIQRLGQAGFISTEEEWIRDFLTMPKKDPSVVLPAAQKPGFPGQASDGSQAGNDPTNEKKTAQNDTKKPAPGDNKPPAGDTTPPDQAKMAEFKEREPDEFEKKIKVKSFKDNLDKIDSGLFDDATKALEGMRDELIAKVQKRKIVENGNPREVQALQVNAKELNDVFSKWMIKVFLDSKLAQLEEMSRAGLNVEITKKFADTSTDWIPLPPQEAVDFFRRKVVAKLVTADGTKKIIDLVSGDDITFFRNRAFTVAGVVRDDILNDAKQVLLNGIKRVDEPGAIKDLKNLFNRYLEQGVAVDGDLLAPHRLNTIVRTNVTEALNEGRASMIEDPDIKDFVQFFSYSAILDDRTTDYCQCMDGRVFRVEDMPILKPPAHYNCRSFIVPITQFEVERKKQSGQGIEVDDPCPGRMSGFSDLKRSAISMIPDAILDVAIPELKNIQSHTDRIKKQLETVVVRCPYKICGSNEIRFRKVIYNVGEFVCDKCTLPFRVSNVGDMYLYDAGLEKWQRVSEGLMPQYFQEYVSAPLMVCPYNFCRSSKIKLKFESENIFHYQCPDCTLPSRLSKNGEIYLYDAGEESWKKVMNGH